MVHVTYHRVSILSSALCLVLQRSPIKVHTSQWRTSPQHNTRQNHSHKTAQMMLKAANMSGADSSSTTAIHTSHRGGWGGTRIKAACPQTPFSARKTACKLPTADQALRRRNSGKKGGASKRRDPISNCCCRPTCTVGCTKHASCCVRDQSAISMRRPAHKICSDVLLCPGTLILHREGSRPARTGKAHQQQRIRVRVCVTQEAAAAAAPTAQAWTSGRLG